MALFGTLINGLCIVIGSVIGLFFSNIPDRYKETVMQGIGLVVIVIGLDMAFASDKIIITLLSLLTGTIIGEYFLIEDKLNQFGEWAAYRFARTKGDSTVVQGFVTASLIFGVGAMSILGALDGGIRGDHGILMTKGIIDGFIGLVLTTTLGFGVIYSVIPVVIYQGTIALFATQIEEWIPEAFLNGLIAEITSVGGIMIVAIGLNLLKIVNIRIANLLPAILTVGLIYYLYSLF